ncbi:phosphopentomutase [Pontivivens insulae]|uniref:Phosphopentomutase n=1 Tax=Pontivivens insulae TaxID=1639689 RepID=A0A2R8AE29_9RHOB|nr:phosphopentomutase [Pontivivens insulae]RED14263.1 phosphopentomutase [Pontivivens insulae]SPF30338.1 Phosphopentomutase [Pontivivens insulae]
MARAFLMVMDSVGCGGAPDAAQFGDEGSNTLGHIAQACAEGRAEEGRTGPLHMPNLDRLGLGAAIRLASGLQAPGLDAVPQAAWGAATELSQGKDTPSGHWELAGVPVPFDWHYFPNANPAFPKELTDHLIANAKLPGILGNKHASGMPIIRELAEQHISTGAPICYTSADSVFQIAAHEDHFGLDRLYEVCEEAAKLVHPMMVGRVIARPFVGEPGNFTRTANRRDYAIEPPEPTLCDRAVAGGGRTIAVGKIGDIFAHRGISELHKAKDDMGLFDHCVRLMEDAADGDFVFANFVEFDSLYGHPRDVSGYARALEAFDARVPELLGRLRPDDLMIFTADHGNDPTWSGTEHTRERVPVLAVGLGQRALGLHGFADVGETVAAHLGLAPGNHGKSLI